MIGCDTFLVALTVADDVLFGQAVLLAKVRTKLHRFLVDLVEVGLIRKPVLTDFKANVRIVGRTACMPSTVLPGQRLIGCHTSVSQLSNKAVDADLSSAGMIGVPVVVVLVFTQLSVIWADIAFQPGIVGTGGMHHNALDSNLSASFVAGVFRKNEFVEIHSVYLPFLDLLRFGRGWMAATVAGNLLMHVLGVAWTVASRQPELVMAVELTMVPISLALYSLNIKLFFTRA